MNTLLFLITWRYLQGTHQEKNISLMALLCFMGIAISALALTLVTSIMNGFETATHQKLQGIHAQIIMKSSDNELLDEPRIATILHREFPAIAAWSPTTYKQVIIRTNDSTSFQAVLAKAIDPEKERQTTTLIQTIITPLSAQTEGIIFDSQDSIIIGSKLALALSVAPEDTVSLLYTPATPAKTRRVTLEEKRVTIKGIFTTGIEEFDTGLILISFPLLYQLFPDAGVTQFNIRLHKGADEGRTILKLKQRFTLDTFSWKDLYPPLVAALKLEKYTMFFILALITLVASMSIIALLFMQIIQKKSDIALYLAMGMQKRDIIKLFMGMGIGLSVIATLFGLLLAFLIGSFLAWYPFITLPDTYYVSQLPIHMEISIFLSVFILIISMSCIATWIPCRTIKSSHAATILRFER